MIGDSRERPQARARSRVLEKPKPPCGHFSGKYSALCLSWACGSYLSSHTWEAKARELHELQAR